MKVSDTQKAALSLIRTELIRFESVLDRYTKVSSFESCTSFESGKDVSDEELINCHFIAKNIESFVINLGSDWPENIIFHRSVSKYRKQWELFVLDNGIKKCLNFAEYHYLNKIIDLWEVNLGIQIDDKEVSKVSLPKAWHYALAQVLLQKVGAIESTIGKKSKTINQAMQLFKITEKMAASIYDSTKKMKDTYNSNNNLWDIDYFFKNFAPKYHIDYKSIVHDLLNGNEKAIELLKELTY